MPAGFRGQVRNVAGAAIVLAALVVCTVLLWQRVVRPFVQVAYARNWVAVPAIVETSVAEPVSESSDYVRPRIGYRYSFGGQENAAERYQFFEFGVKSKRRMRDIVAAYPVGAAITVYVDPHEPSQAVIRRGLTLDARGPLIFISVAGLMAMGAVSMLVAALGRRNTENQPKAARFHPDGKAHDMKRSIHDIDADLVDAELKLPVPVSMLTSLTIALALAFFATFATFVYDALRESVIDGVLLATFLCLPVCLVAIGWYRKRRDPRRAIYVRLRLLEELRFGSTNRFSCEILGPLPVAKAVFRVEAHTWPPSQATSLIDRRRYCHRTAWVEIPPDAMTLKLVLPPDPRPPHCDHAQWIGWYIRVDLTLPGGRTTTRLQELARFPPSASDE